MNPNFEHCRHIALELLRPTEKELKHGLELHHLVQRGFSDGEIKKITDGNVPRVIEKTLA